MPERSSAHPGRPAFVVTGHRGDGAGPDENTAGSFRAALRHGAARLETDVQLIDGELVLAHPPRQPRMTLTELLDLTDAPLVLHLKRRHFSPWQDRRTVRQLLPLIKQRPGVSISSFWPGTLRWMRRQRFDIPTIFNTWAPTYDLLFSRGIGATEYVCWHRTITARTVRWAARRGITLSAFIVPPTESAVQKFTRLGLHRIMTDHVAFFARQPARPARPRSARGRRRPPAR